MMMPSQLLRYVCFMCSYGSILSPFAKISNRFYSVMQKGSKVAKGSFLDAGKLFLDECGFDDRSVSHLYVERFARADFEGIIEMEAESAESNEPELVSLSTTAANAFDAEQPIERSFAYDAYEANVTDNADMDTTGDSNTFDAILAEILADLANNPLEYPQDSEENVAMAMDEVNGSSARLAVDTESPDDSAAAMPPAQSRPLFPSPLASPHNSEHLTLSPLASPGPAGEAAAAAAAEAWVPPPLGDVDNFIASPLDSSYSPPPQFIFILNPQAAAAAVPTGSFWLPFSLPQTQTEGEGSFPSSSSSLQQQQQQPEQSMQSGIFENMDNALFNAAVANFMAQVQSSNTQNVDGSVLVIPRGLALNRNAQLQNERRQLTNLATKGLLHASLKRSKIGQFFGSELKLFRERLQNHPRDSEDFYELMGKLLFDDPELDRVWMSTSLPIGYKTMQRIIFDMPKGDEDQERLMRICADNELFDGRIRGDARRDLQRKARAFIEQHMDAPKLMTFAMRLAGLSVHREGRNYAISEVMEL